MLKKLLSAPPCEIHHNLVDDTVYMKGMNNEPVPVYTFRRSPQAIKETIIKTMEAKIVGYMVYLADGQAKRIPIKYKVSDFIGY